jgi:hypothetical protein
MKPAYLPLSIALALASTQALAISSYYSINSSNWSSWSTWDTASCAGPGGGSSSPLTSNDAAIICSGKTVFMNTLPSVGYVTVNSGGTLDMTISGGVLTVGSFTNLGGTVTTGAFAHSFGQINHSGGTTNLSSATTTFVGGGVMVTASGLTLPSGLTLINGYLNVGTTFSLPASVTSVTGNLTVSTGGSLTFLGSNTSIGGGSIYLNDPAATILSGTLKFSAGNKTIYAMTSAKTIPTLDISAMANGNTIAAGVAPTYYDVTITNLSTAGGKHLDCGGTSYSTGPITITAGSSCTVVAPSAVSAPIDLRESGIVTTRPQEISIAH